MRVRFRISVPRGGLLEYDAESVGQIDNDFAIRSRDFRDEAVRNPALGCDDGNVHFVTSLEAGAAHSITQHRGGGGEFACPNNLFSAGILRFPCDGYMRILP